MINFRLINCVDPSSGEWSIPRFVAHLAVINHYPSMSFLLSGADLLGKGDVAATIDLEKATFGEADLIGLAGLAGCSISQAQALTYPAASNDTRWKEHLFRGYSVPWTALAPLRPRACLPCVAEGRRSRLWDLTWYTACHRHKVLLTDSCTSADCGRDLDLFTLELGYCAKCRVRLTEPTASAPESAVALSRELAVLTGFEQGETSSDAQSPTCLHQSINALAPVALPESTLGRFDYLPQRWSIARLTPIVEIVWPLVRRPGGGSSFVEQLVQTSRQRYPSLPDGARLIRLRNAIRALSSSPTQLHLAKQWDSAIASTRATGPVENAPDLEPFATMRDLPELLGTSPHNVKLLIKRGFLDAGRAFAERKLAEWIVPTSSVNRLLQRIAQSSSLLRSSDSQLTAWNDYCQHPAAARIGGFNGVLEALLSGEIRAVGAPEDVRFSNLQIDTRSSNMPVVGSESLSVAQAAAHLNTYTDAIYRLLKTPLLVASSVVLGGRRIQLIARDELARFHQSYVIASELARAWKVNVTNLTDRLRDMGIQPVSGPKIDGGLLFVFRRSDIDGLNLSEMLAKVRYASAAGRPGRGSAPRTHAPECVTSEVAASFLGLSIQQVSRLVMNGHLNAHPDSRAIKNSRFLYRAEVVEYRKTWIDVSGQISVDAAAERLNCTKKQFNLRYVIAGLIEVVKAPHGPRMVDEKKLEALQLSERPMSLGEVSRALGVPASRIVQLKRQEKIEACPLPGRRFGLYSPAEARERLDAAIERQPRRRR